MQLSPPFSWTSLSDLGRWGRELVGDITRGWNVEHRQTGGHRFPWKPVPFTAASFKADAGMTWTVDAADVVTYEYRVIDDTLELAWKIRNTDIGGTPSSELRLSLPPGFVAASDRTTTAWYNDAGTQGTGFAGCVAGEVYVRLYKNDGSAWTATTSDNTSTGGYIAVKVR